MTSPTKPSLVKSHLILSLKFVTTPPLERKSIVIWELGCHPSNSSLGFILPLTLLEAGFHLFLYPFFCVVLNNYEIAPCQLSAISWWTLVAFFINYCIHNEHPLLSVFQRFYQLKKQRIGASVGNAHFNVRSGYELLNKNKISNLHMRNDKYIRVVSKLRFNFGF
ncbi:hypothetical protein J1N35_043950 [Gossypium stocksii]|uniref:Transposase (putative) gypsy type domain-containing protein n=1 Tax=Gossypium stocksii TaxID=47602 RepID=A0A9D3ZFJ7_9ROSI|nr:hypothetical protein J1N35_043950 [Gossypium stocksii]